MSPTRLPSWTASRRSQYRVEIYKVQQMSPEQEAAMVAQVGIQTSTHPDAVAVSVCYSTNAEVQLFSLRMRLPRPREGVRSWGGATTALWGDSWRQICTVTLAAGDRDGLRRGAGPRGAAGGAALRLPVRPLVVHRTSRRSPKRNKMDKEVLMAIIQGYF